MSTPKDLKVGYLPEIFEKQRATMEKFHGIEKANGALQTEDVPVDLDSFPGQARLRDFAWRITEELVEAYSALQDLICKNNQMGDFQPIGEEGAELLISLWSKFKEELMDCVHFLVEFSILAGYDFRGALHQKDMLKVLVNVNSFWTIDSIEQNIFSVITRLGMCVNTLRNRAWKQTARPIDYKLFYFQLEETWVQFGQLLSCACFTPRAIFIGYCGKNEINKQRQESGV